MYFYVYVYICVSMCIWMHVYSSTLVLKCVLICVLLLLWPVNVYGGLLVAALLWQKQTGILTHSTLSSD